MPNKEDLVVGKIAKSMKWGGGALFLGVNAFLFYHYINAYEDGQRRGAILHK